MQHRALVGVLDGEVVGTVGQTGHAVGASQGLRSSAGRRGGPSDGVGGDAAVDIEAKLAVVVVIAVAVRGHIRHRQLRGLVDGKLGRSGTGGVNVVGHRQRVGAGGKARQRGCRAGEAQGGAFPFVLVVAEGARHVRVGLAVVVAIAGHVGGLHIDGQRLGNGKVESGDLVTALAQEGGFDVVTGGAVVAAVESPHVLLAAGGVVDLAGAHVLHQVVDLADGDAGIDLQRGLAAIGDLNLTTGIGICDVQHRGGCTHIIPRHTCVVVLKIGSDIVHGLHTQQLEGCGGGGRGVRGAERLELRVLEVSAVYPVLGAQQRLQIVASHILGELLLVVGVEQVHHTEGGTHTHVANSIGGIIRDIGSGGEAAGMRSCGNNLTGVVNTGGGLGIAAGDATHIISTADNTRVVTVAQIGTVLTGDTAAIITVSSCTSGSHTSHIEGGGGHTADDASDETTDSAALAGDRVGVVASGDGSVLASAHQTADMCTASRHRAIHCRTVGDGSLVETAQSTHTAIASDGGTGNGQILDGTGGAAEEALVIIVAVNSHPGDGLVVAVEIAFEGFGHGAYRGPVVR